jgi:hypothetical protein
MRNFKKLLIWQLGMEIVDKVYEFGCRLQAAGCKLQAASFPKGVLRTGLVEKDN